jgi:hypothetical protein
MNDQEDLQETYPFEVGTRTYTIPVSIEHYQDFTTDMDPSPAPTRDLAIELVDYLNQCSDEIPCRYPISLHFHIRADTRDMLSEKICMDSLRNFFQHEVYVGKSEIRRKRVEALKYLLVSFLCLSIYVVSDKFGSASFFPDLFREALLIGGWVFMWETVTINFIEMDKYYQNIKKLKRLIEAKVIYTYTME